MSQLPEIAPDADAPPTQEPSAPAIGATGSTSDRGSFAMRSEDADLVRERRAADHLIKVDDALAALHADFVDLPAQILARLMADHLYRRLDVRGGRMLTPKLLAEQDGYAGYIRCALRYAETRSLGDYYQVPLLRQALGQAKPLTRKHVNEASWLIETVAVETNDDDWRQVRPSALEEMVEEACRRGEDEAGHRRT